jgi:hypothetical protein
MAAAGPVGDAAWLVVARSLDDRDAPSSAPPEQEVRAALASITDALRERGCGPERVLVLVKGIAHATLASRRMPLLPHEQAERMSCLVSWTIDAYYADA